MKKLTMLLLALFMFTLTGAAVVQANPAGGSAWQALEAGDPPPPPPDADQHKHKKHKEEPRPPQEPPREDAPKDHAPDLPEPTRP